MFLLVCGFVVSGRLRLPMFGWLVDGVSGFGSLLFGCCLSWVFGFWFEFYVLVFILVLISVFVWL